jgi:hypothetical protein
MTMVPQRVVNTAGLALGLCLVALTAWHINSPDVSQHSELFQVMSLFYAPTLSPQVRHAP